MQKHTLAERVAQIAPFQVMAVLARAKYLASLGEDVIHLEVGEPDFTAVEAVAKAGVAAIQSGNTGYTAATGLPELKQAISDDYLARYDVAVSPERIIVTPGASGALLLMASLMANPGEEVLMPDPCYPCNRHFLIQTGANARLIETRPDDGFEMELSALAGHWNENTSGLWLASPSNPTGAVLSKAYLTEAWEKVQALGGHLLVDEIYQGLVYDGEDFSALSIAEDIFVINSFSKYFAMTGWRLGWIVVPEWAIEGATKLAQNLFISAPTVSQYAAVRAFQPDVLAECESRRQILNGRRLILLKGLKDIGLPVVAPAQGAFYVYVDVSSVTQDAMSWCLALLETEKVALTPGADFGIKDAHKYVRFAYTCDEGKLKQALVRIARFIAS
ncbi:aminotransferase class I/II-fold pyridoxal phosphate-dependent enzyme [Marinomonas sp. IMCC 4694]|uniref:aminotransferase class I/II-fold pyridoxal phosphate-dependent enzyme n=1 Tax=Marinomonas sp. IMCC 4694 TaxID=2605432 RepID=UPI0011E83BEB|nr:aminotransferase class I/II-fold pyridoxal phosphate-dependent enzyme [Marinomonas sp. IMCC 4694]TYL46738.1 aminotransferase class I/II-fold pyridoxal phosphate-dependent enzyme [Marinomonas sp. IMCC 4694]